MAVRNKKVVHTVDCRGMAVRTKKVECTVCTHRVMVMCNVHRGRA